MNLEDERKILAQSCITDKWSKVYDIASFKANMGICAFCHDAKRICLENGEKINDPPRNMCKYCKGSMKICDGFNVDTVYGRLQRFEGTDEEFMEIVRKGLGDYAEKWLQQN